MIRPSPIRVLSVDDSAFFRRVLTEILGHHGDIHLLGCAKDAYDARDRLLSFSVDVLTLDLEMPRMGGLTFLKLLMERKPMPVVVVSSLTPTGSQLAVEALVAGACAVVEKPADSAHRHNFGEKLIKDIKLAANSPGRYTRRLVPNPSLRTAPSRRRPTIPGKSSPSALRPAGRRRSRPSSRRSPPSSPAFSSCNTSRPASPRVSPPGSTAVARWKCARQKMAT
jgi:two-component system chemotaxis response regulator CheB